MMTTDVDTTDLIKTYREIERSLSTTISINYSQVAEIAAADLMGKYKHATNDKFRNALKLVLLGYYLSPDEFDELLESD